jgi:hypothetical protein
MFLDPLPASVVSTLRTNETAALAAAMIIAGSSPDIVSFAPKGRWRGEGRSARTSEARQRTSEAR